MSESARIEIDGFGESRLSSLGSTVKLNSTTEAESESVKVFHLDASSLSGEMETERIGSEMSSNGISTEMRCFGDGAMELADGEVHVRE
jgi:hypothetical protein